VPEGTSAQATAISLNSGRDARKRASSTSEVVMACCIWQAQAIVAPFFGSSGTCSFQKWSCAIR